MSIIIRLFEALNNIKPGSELNKWKDDLLKFNHFKEDSVMERFYISICNLQLAKTEMEAIENNELSFIEVEQYLKTKSKSELENYIYNFFPSWYEKPR